MIFRRNSSCLNHAYPLWNVVQRLWVVLLAIGGLVGRKSKYNHNKQDNVYTKHEQQNNVCTHNKLHGAYTSCDLWTRYGGSKVTLMEHGGERLGQGWAIHVCTHCEINGNHKTDLTAATNVVGECVQRSSSVERIMLSTITMELCENNVDMAYYTCHSTQLGGNWDLETNS